ncbi:heavy metal translocating P-type ATPase metal-binding domain-containing protein [Mucilaginibacter sp. L3T2-6]|uniref:heavy metal translocating P-type ATPase n=1 Tax=Mucilaginibacter sp. L3T2-6 TaxID=3062491 RepID=UPI00267470D0|nr:heavy metal translocating P-type ATPase metal-binding domain-containing protein [Mucilaginibacter sp. L3T2-6]MDO3642205.1 heavy metal translocating P-type ATPase metal-binding domain-containing protein [Mucilaginibacter sp. L3T2-6]MDV6214700.1 heavy metal translocating P-type ATPase metal-binding domain-containing protein [Mucilaginibacter sp. L3T2-6]
MTETLTAQKSTCYHCGDDCFTTDFIAEDKHFCCQGCKSVYLVLAENKLCNYYSYNRHPGSSQARTDKRFDYLSDPAVASDLIDYTDPEKTIITFYIPQIHCSSCLWLLEQLNRINPAVHYTRVDFLKKQLNVRFDQRQLTVRGLVELLSDIGYEPVIRLQDVIKEQASATKDNLVSKIAVAGFCFGNVMLLSFPEYLGMSAFENSFKYFFGIVNVLICLPVVFYSGWGYFTSAYQHLKNKVLHIDFPLALGIAVLFIRTVAEVFTKSGPGFADTLCGLVFFLLVGKFVQKKTYYHISFERDYRSFFPVAVHVIEHGKEKPVPLSQLQTNQRIIIRHNEIIPADAILLKGDALIDFSFVTGEAIPVSKTLGEIIYAGGRQTGGAIELEVIKAVSQSYLTQLWNNEAFTRKQHNRMQTFNQRVGKYFTIVLLAIALSSFVFWAGEDIRRGLAAFTAVLIVACPCALALSTPFTMSAALSIFDKNLFYLKNPAVVEQLAHIDTIALDKTGTITNSGSNEVELAAPLNDKQKQLIYTACSGSNHPLSRMICKYLGAIEKLKTDSYDEIAGKGIAAVISNHSVRLGSADFVFNYSNVTSYSTKVYILIDDVYYGYFSFRQHYREGINDVAGLAGTYDIHLISGDQDHEREELKSFFRDDARMHFSRSPQEKLDFIKSLQSGTHKVMMIGDGLNDSGALKQSDLGIAITDDVNSFSPGSDAILDGRSFGKLPAFLKFAKDTVKVIHASFLISLTYNLIGLSYAVTGRLSPLTAAILMPVSTVTIISFTSIATHLAAKRRKLL